MDAFFHVIDLTMFSCQFGRAGSEGGAFYGVLKGECKPVFQQADPADDGATKPAPPLRLA
jgi:hypothetical protein